MKRPVRSTRLRSWSSRRSGTPSGCRRFSQDRSGACGFVDLTARGERALVRCQALGAPLFEARLLENRQRALEVMYGKVVLSKCCMQLPELLVPGRQGSSLVQATCQLDG